MNGQKNLSENPAPKGPGKVSKFALMGFVALSIGAAVYKIAGSPCCSGSKAQAAPVEAASIVTDTVKPAVKSEGKTPASAAKLVAKPAVEAKTAVVYYFYTNTRCSSCKTIEAYTREAVEKNFGSDYKGWKMVFKGVNVEDEPNAHFVQDYFLNSKSVVVQKFSGDKVLKWGKLEKVWQLLGDKEAFMNYITGETYKLLDEK